jgi:hypothetical protein
MTGRWKRWRARETDGVAGAIFLDRSKRTRRAVLLALGLSLALPSAAPARVTQPPIKITWDASCPIVGDRAVIPWSWTKRSGLKPSDTLTIQYRPYQKGAWKTIASDVRLDHNRKSWRLEGRYIWDASTINPGRAVRYEARLIIDGKRIGSPAYAFWIDHVPPMVRITEPVAMFEVPGPEGKPVSATVARGVVHFRASVVEKPRAFCYEVLWKWEGPILTYGPSKDLKSVRITKPSPFILTAIAVDRAGNASSTQPLYVLGLPGNDMTPMRLPMQQRV